MPFSFMAAFDVCWIFWGISKCIGISVRRFFIFELEAISFRMLSWRRGTEENPTSSESFDR